MNGDDEAVAAAVPSLQQQPQPDGARPQDADDATGLRRIAAARRACAAAEAELARAVGKAREEGESWAAIADVLGVPPLTASTYFPDEEPIRLRRIAPRHQREHDRRR